MDFLSLCEKEVVDISSGIKLGYVENLVFDEARAAISCIVVSGRGQQFRLFSKPEAFEVPWQDIKVIGDDAILADASKISGIIIGKNKNM